MEELPRIRKRITCLLWFIGPLAVVWIVFGVLLSGLVIHDFRDRNEFRKEEKTCVLAAAQDMTPGEVLRVDLLGTLSVDDDELPRGYIMPRDFEVILGHALTNPVAKKQPLTWYDVGIPIPEAIEKANQETAPSDRPD
jgi:hypothetical protein